MAVFVKEKNHAVYAKALCCCWYLYVLSKAAHNLLLLIFILGALVRCKWWYIYEWAIYLYYYPSVRLVLSLSERMLKQATRLLNRSSKT